MTEHCKHEWMLVDKYLEDTVAPKSIGYVMICKWCLEHEIVELRGKER